MSASDTESRVLWWLLRRRWVSVPFLVQWAGMTPSTAMRTLRRLAQEGAAERGPDVAERRGRPIAQYRLRVTSPVLSCLVDGSECLAARIDRDGVMRPIERLAIAPAECEEATTRVVRWISELTSRYDVSGVALTLNAVQIHGHVVTSSVLPEARTLMHRLLGEEVSVPVRLFDTPRLQAELRALDTWPQGPVMVFNVGDGISSHTVVEGQRVPGAARLAGELGHVTFDAHGPLCGCGRRGCLEAVANGNAMRSSVQAESAERIVPALRGAQLANGSSREVVARLWKAWEQEDSYARQFMEVFLDRWAWGLALAINITDPAVVIFSGYAMAGHPGWREEVRRRALRQVMHANKREITWRSAAVKEDGLLRHLALEYFYESQSIASTQRSDQRLSNAALIGTSRVNI